jgi:hypothetical protein
VSNNRLTSLTSAIQPWSQMSTIEFSVVGAAVDEPEVDLRTSPALKK